MLSPLYGQLSPLRIPLKNQPTDFPEDSDATAYIAAVETADGQSLEAGVKNAINNFVAGCKYDGIWNSIKASCLLAGARTLAGALKPLVGATSTNFNFVSADYNRKLGLLGNGTTKYLASNRNGTDDPQNNHHMSVWRGSVGAISTLKYYINAGPGSTGASSISQTNGTLQTWSRNSGTDSLANAATQTGFYGISRSSSASYLRRSHNTTTSVTRASQSPASINIWVFRRNPAAGALDERIAFYSIGESLYLDALDTRVSTLMTDLAAAIP